MKQSSILPSVSIYPLILNGLQSITNRSKFNVQRSKFAFLLPHILLLIIFTSGCEKQPARINRLEWPTMGTIAAVQSIDIDTAQQLREIAIDEFKTIEKELSSWNKESTLSIINHRSGSDTPTPVSESFFDILNISTTISRQSNGAFSPLLGPVLHAWGFGNVTTPMTPPAETTLDQALQLTDLSDIRIATLTGTHTVQLTHKDMELDFGAVAKGYAVDLVWGKAKEKHITNALIDLGGNLRALGEARPGRGGWLTGVKDPFNKNNLIAKLLILDGEAISTSGNYERFVKINGERYAHIIDGRTAMPVKGMAGVTVVSPDAATADALSTTLFVLGVDEGMKLIRKHYPNSLALWIPDSKPAEIIATDKMEKRLERLDN